MRKEGFKWAVVCSLVLIAVGGCHRIDEDDPSTRVSEGEELRTNPANGGSTGVSQEEAQKSWEPVPAGEQGIDNLWALFPGEPQRSFRRGRDDLLKKKYRTASQKIRKSTMYVKLQTLRAFGPTKTALLKSEAALRELSQNVEKGKIFSLEGLDTTFAATERVIARLHQEKAEEAYAQGELRTAGVELRAAKDSLGRSAVWTGDHMDPALIDCTDRAGEVAMRLIERADWAPANTRKALSDLGAQIDRLDRKAEAEDAWGLFLGETQFYLKEAQDMFKGRDMKGAAANMRRAGACMVLEAFGSSGDAKRFLEKEIQALRKAAEEVENGSLTSAKKIRRRFSMAQYALARVHHMQAERCHAQHYYPRSVTALRATVTDLERTASWAGKGMKKSSIRVMEQAKDMSRRMREGRHVSPEEISAVISDLKKAIGRLDTLAVSP